LDYEFEEPHPDPPQKGGSFLVFPSPKGRELPCVSLLLGGSSLVFPSPLGGGIKRGVLIQKSRLTTKFLVSLEYGVKIYTYSLYLTYYLLIHRKILIKFVKNSFQFFPKEELCLKLSEKIQSQ
jgi:hypothetical protein